MVNSKEILDYGKRVVSRKGKVTADADLFTVVDEVVGVDDDCGGFGPPEEPISGLGPEEADGCGGLGPAPTDGCGNRPTAVAG